MLFYGYKVTLSKQAEKDLRRVPSYIALKLQAWVDDLTHRGLAQLRKIPGYHDEPLKGKRNGQRSIRLSRAYRAIYILDESDDVKLIEVIEVNKHEY